MPVVAHRHRFAIRSAGVRSLVRLGAGATFSPARRVCHVRFGRDVLVTSAFQRWILSYVSVGTTSVPLRLFGGTLRRDLLVRSAFGIIHFIDRVPVAGLSCWSNLNNRGDSRIPRQHICQTQMHRGPERAIHELPPYPTCHSSSKEWGWLRLPLPLACAVLRFILELWRTFWD